MHTKGDLNANINLHCSFLATTKPSASFISRLASHWQHRKADLWVVNTNMISNERGRTKYPQTGGTGENTTFAKQSRKKERGNGHDTTLCYNFDW